jgi:uncharacterized membrane protein YfcA
VTLASAALLVGSATLAGVMNAVAGGGTLVTFPALLAAGLPPVQANVTSTLAVYPGQVSSSLVYRGHLDEVRGRIVFFALPALLGGALGSALLLLLPERSFVAVVPWLILLACALIALQTPLKAALARWPHADHPAALWLSQLAISVYGGYFGAGMGIMMLAAMGLMLREGLQHANALKNLNALFTNSAAVVLFLFLARVRWPEVAVMAAASLLGGWIGAHFAQRLPPALMRGLAIAIGLVAATRFFLR